MNFLNNFNPILLAFLGTMFTFFITSLGAALVFFFKKTNKLIMNIMLSISAGVMLAAAFWSLLNPASTLACELHLNAFLIITVGFILGGLLIFIGNKLNVNNKRTSLLLFSITLHNIPEGLAIGVAFGSILYGLENANLYQAILLTIGIGIQNFPEGSAISLPLLRDGYSRKKAFIYGCMSGIVEPISGVIGALLAIKVKYILPFLLAFAAGAMIYVVTEEIIPECQNNNKKDLMALFTIIGFSIMMLLDISFS